MATCSRPYAILTPPEGFREALVLRSVKMLPDPGEGKVALEGIVFDGKTYEELTAPGPWKHLTVDIRLEDEDLIYVADAIFPAVCSDHNGLWAAILLLNAEQV